MNFYFILTIMPGFFAARFFSGKSVGERGRIKSLKLKISCYIFHLHHWVWSLGLVIMLPNFNFDLAPLRGMLLGFFLQGLTYPDFYKFFYRIDKENKSSNSS